MILHCPQCGKSWSWDGERVCRKEWTGETMLPGHGRNYYTPAPTDTGRATCPRCHFAPIVEASPNNTDTCLAPRQKIKRGQMLGG